MQHSAFLQAVHTVPTILPICTHMVLWQACSQGSMTTIIVTYASFGSSCSLTCQLALSMYGWRARNASLPDGKAVDREVFWCKPKRTMAWPSCKRQHPHCSMKEVGRMLTKKQTDAFHKTMGENEKGSRKIKVKERAPKLLIFGSKSTRPRDLLHFEI